MRNKYKIIIIIISNILFTFVSKAQNDRLLVSADAHIPRLIANNIYKDAFNGIVDARLDLNYILFKGLYFGAGGKVTQIQYREYRYGEISTDNLITNAHGRLGYMLNKSSAIFNFSVSYGYSWNNFTNVKTDTILRPSPNTSGIHVEPSLGVYWYIDENKNFLIGGNISYNVFYSPFNPYSVALDVFSSYAFTKNDYKANTQYLNVGVGFIYLLGKKNTVGGSLGDDE